MDATVLSLIGWIESVCFVDPGILFTPLKGGGGKLIWPLHFLISSYLPRGLVLPLSTTSERQGGGERPCPLINFLAVIYRISYNKIYPHLVRASFSPPHPNSCISPYHGATSKRRQQRPPFHPCIPPLLNVHHTWLILNSSLISPSSSTVHPRNASQLPNLSSTASKQQASST